MPNFKQRSAWLSTGPIKRHTTVEGGRAESAAIAGWGATWTWGTYLAMLLWGQHQFRLSAHRSEPQLGGSAGPGSIGCQWLNCLVSAAAQVHRPSDSHWGLTHPVRGHSTRKVIRNSTPHTLAWSKEEQEFKFCVFNSKHQEVLF